MNEIRIESAGETTIRREQNHRRILDLAGWRSNRKRFGQSGEY
jgi:hypothetical protein